MIDVVLVLDADGCLSSVEANGHAGKGVRGSDPVCAAV
ncbi:MAG TPA: ribosomal-processing cysteine protease Prp, partial [Treponemataceae bacterium]|nr:ribosomal-processing cysteine protease Prp [Treponemataceae bacterium]